MIEVEGLTKRFGSVAAVDDISFSIASGEIVGLLGPNGAGKTTPLRILSTFLPATGGTVTIAGKDVFKEPVEVRRRVGYLPEHVPLYVEMRVHEYLSYRGRLKGMAGGALRRRIGEMLEVCGLEDMRRSIVGHLSKGYRQRVGLADSLLNEPGLLILDEPTIGLDPNQIRQIRELIRSLAPRHTVLLSSHILSEVEKTCRRVLIMHRGRIVASDTTDNLVGLVQGNPLAVLQVKGPSEEVTAKLSQVGGVLRVERREDPVNGGDWVRYECECQKGGDPCPGLFRAVADNHWSLRELRLQRGRLEDVFVEVTADSEGT